jgi:hypothetical protein
VANKAGQPQKKIQLIRSSVFSSMQTQARANYASLSAAVKSEDSRWKETMNEKKEKKVKAGKRDFLDFLTGFSPFDPTNPPSEGALFSSEPPDAWHNTPRGAAPPRHGRCNRSFRATRGARYFQGICERW